MVEVITANCDGTVMSPDGCPYCARLKALNTSHRNSSEALSVIANCLESPKSS